LLGIRPQPGEPVTIARVGSHRAEPRRARRAAPSAPVETDRHDHRHHSSPGHPAGHTHSHDLPEVEVAHGPRIAMLVVLAVVGLAVIGGIVGMWPDRGRVHDLAHSLDFAAPGVTFPQGTVDSVQPPCANGEATATCGNLIVTVDGRTVKVTASPDVLQSGLTKGDGVQLQRTPPAGGQPAAYSYYKTDRGTSLWLLVGLFVVVVLAVARLRGLMAIVSLFIGGLVIGGWLLPGLLSGHSPTLVGLVAAVAIMYVVLYLTHGPNLRTSAALLGTVGGLAITAGIGILAVHLTHLTGVSDESGSILTSVSGHLDFQGLMTCTVIIAGLGVLNDVTITQASAVWELRAASPGMTRRGLVLAAMRIGRDHIASTIYTILFAYAGTALMTLLVIQLYNRPFGELLGTEQLSEEIVRSLVSSIGLILAVPITTAVAALTVPGPRQPLSPDAA